MNAKHICLASILVLTACSSGTSDVVLSPGIDIKFPDELNTDSFRLAAENSERLKPVLTVSIGGINSSDELPENPEGLEPYFLIESGTEGGAWVLDSGDVERFNKTVDFIKGTDTTSMPSTISVDWRFCSIGKDCAGISTLPSDDEVSLGVTTSSLTSDGMDVVAGEPEALVPGFTAIEGTSSLLARSNLAYLNAGIEFPVSGYIETELGNLGKDEFTYTRALSEAESTSCTFDVSKPQWDSTQPLDFGDNGGQWLIGEYSTDTSKILCVFLSSDVGGVTIEDNDGNSIGTPLETTNTYKFSNVINEGLVKIQVTSHSEEVQQTANVLLREIVAIEQPPSASGDDPLEIDFNLDLGNVGLKQVNENFTFSLNPDSAGTDCSFEISFPEEVAPYDRLGTSPQDQLTLTGLQDDNFKNDSGTEMDLKLFIRIVSPSNCVFNQTILGVSADLKEVEIDFQIEDELSGIDAEGSELQSSATGAYSVIECEKFEVIFPDSSWSIVSGGVQGDAVIGDDGKIIANVVGIDNGSATIEVKSSRNIASETIDVSIENMNDDTQCSS